MSAPTLTQRRKALGLTRTELAALLGVVPTVIDMAEQGRRFDGRPYKLRGWYVLALEAIEARAAAGTLIVPDARRVGRPRTPLAQRSR